MARRWRSQCRGARRACSNTSRNEGRMGCSCLTFREEPLAHRCVAKAEPSSTSTTHNEGSRDPALRPFGRGSRVELLGLLHHSKRNRAALSRPVAWAMSVRHSIAPSHSAHASIVALDRDRPTATEPSSLVRVTAVASVVPLTVCRSASIDPDAPRSYVHTLSQTWRWRCNRHCANESQCNQCSRDQHGLSPFPCSVSV
jgi:hypothetical protein